MKSAQELYPDLTYQSIDGSTRWAGASDYQPIIDEFGEVLIQVDDSDYQGDTRVLYKKNGKFGYLIFGWGSCSGCDSLQACRTIQEIEALMGGLENDIIWFDTLEDLQKHFREKDWELEYAWHHEETKEFIQKVLNFRPMGFIT